MRVEYFYTGVEQYDTLLNMYMTFTFDYKVILPNKNLNYVYYDNLQTSGRVNKEYTILNN